MPFKVTNRELLMSEAGWGKRLLSGKSLGLVYISESSSHRCYAEVL